MPAAGDLPFRLSINDAYCGQCNSCLAKQICRGSAILIVDPEDMPFIDLSRCWECLKCIAACSCSAIDKENHHAD